MGRGRSDVMHQHPAPLAPRRRAGRLPPDPPHHWASPLGALHQASGIGSWVLPVEPPAVPDPSCLSSARVPGETLAPSSPEIRQGHLPCILTIGPERHMRHVIWRLPWPRGSSPHSCEDSFPDLQNYILSSHPRYVYYDIASDPQACFPGTSLRPESVLPGDD
jgi:hypothetical protein